MISRRKRLAWAAAFGLAALGLGVPASAAQGGPTSTGPAGDHRQVAIDPALLDKYAGFYLLADRAVLTVEREGDHLSIRLTGQPASPVFPEAPARFFARVVDAQFVFQSDASGKVTGVVLHQNGADIPLKRVTGAQAQEVEARTTARVKAQAAAPGTEAAARQLDASIAAGKPDYATMGPALAAATRAQLPKLQAALAGLGPIQDVRFLGVSPQGLDVYDIRHPNGIMRWTIGLGAEGKITSAWVTQGP